MATDPQHNAGTKVDREAGEVVRIEPGARQTDLTGLTDPATGERTVGDDFLRDDFLDAPQDDLLGGAHSGAVGGEKGAVAATMAGETVRGSFERDAFVEPNSPEAIADEYGGGNP